MRCGDGVPIALSILEMLVIFWIICVAIRVVESYAKASSVLTWTRKHCPTAKWSHFHFIHLLYWSIGGGCFCSLTECHLYVLNSKFRNAFQGLASFSLVSHWFGADESIDILTLTKISNAWIYLWDPFPLENASLLVNFWVDWVSFEKISYTT